MWSFSDKILRRIGKISFLVFLLNISFYSIAQNGPFTQYLNNEFIINPAYAGSDDALSLTAVYRSQWSNIEGMPVSQTLSAHSLIKSQNSAMGIILNNDRIGIHKNFTALAAYSYRINFTGEKYLALGIQTGIKNIQSNYSSLLPYAQNPLDPKISSADFNLTRFEAGFGILYTSDRFNFSLSIPSYPVNGEVKTDSLTYYLDKTSVFLLSNYKITVSNNLNIYPGVLINYTKGLPVTYDANLQAEINEVLTFGVSYRHQSSINFLMQAVILPQLKIGYAFDYPTGKNSIFEKGSNELMINYIFNSKKSGIRNPR
ncbi:PorP/SprF family type IX secretion system membrane protein [Mangrovivirga cuniculi]|uniref:Type IX secretion system membrane protein PorP/SprF n=1 Tax=Mangrovivirga cuniculi TaxID=2715131 RepID=A0A4D7KBS3_9BACT|nr:PorP/SprF family type IX secretion system membrane protein [Mangrovivirga cuniculi]QCK16938.1 hypothetical protein DCC35_20485 [Mangrovivirga cuniculi]